ncbi:MFS transporter [Amnibacterium kyonggiense]|uniref:Na+/melibiose symporter-like transporter n=1 Tax=Amnibacterium kyonggiense TaxID=595671 RepID=A0A4R7FIZ6_9MICO|nr:MFS transporter [Amnibacterium kyonggiense]TDS75042.1 Na+/melibiose symporter-like transporter [Amnibacterium kyonggiense]
MAVIEPTGVAAASAGAGAVPGSRRSAGNGVIVAYVIAYLALYIALITPVISTLAVKVNEISTVATRAGDLSLVTGIGAFFAFVANPIAGALSDRTTSRFGMRRPWLVIGVIGGAVGLLVIATASGIWQVVVGWAIAQTAFNGTQAALQAVLPDQVEEHRRGKVSGWLGIAQNASSLIGIGLATLFAAAGLTSFWSIAVPAAIGVVGVVVFAALLHDRRLSKADAVPFHLGAFVKGFWISPRKHPDFAWAFTGRFLMLLGFAAYNGYQVYFLLTRFGFDTPTALSWQLRLSVVQTIVLVVAAALGGWLSDRTGRRKVFVIVATVLAGVGLIVFASAQDPNILFVAAALFGAGLGAYFAVDLALVTDVLPNRETDAAKNMGVFNIANALPQSLAPALAPLLLGIGSTTAGNYTLLFVVAAVVILAGAASTMFIKGAR